MNISRPAATMNFPNPGEFAPSPQIKELNAMREKARQMAKMDNPDEYLNTLSRYERTYIKRLVLLERRLVEK